MRNELEFAEELHQTALEERDSALTRCVEYRKIIDEALEKIANDAAWDGEHHKMRCIDDVVRILTGPDYDKWVAEFNDGEDGPETYDWEDAVSG